MNKIVLCIALMVLVGCTTSQQCPQVQCPSCRCPSVDEPVVDVYFLDVGQGDSMMVKSGSVEMLIDCGPNGAGPGIVDFLKEKGVSSLEFLLITHPDDDHLGGCDEVLEGVTTHTVITNGQVADSGSYREVMDVIDSEQLITARTNDSWMIGDAQMMVLQADNGFDDTNQNSVVTKLTYGNSKVLFTGDCDRDCEDLLLDKDIQAQVLKVAHHGSKFGTEIDFLQEVNPQLAVIEVGANSYGHPAPETLDRLSQEGVQVYRTDFDGDVEVELTKESYEVK